MHTLLEPFMFNAQLAKGYFSELAINACELKDIWKQLF